MDILQPVPSGDLSPDATWKFMIDQVKPRIPPQAFQTWLLPISANAFDQDTLILQVPHRFFREWIEENYLDVLTQILRDMDAGLHNLRFVVPDAAPTRTQPDPIPIRPQKIAKTPTHPNQTALNPRYTFDQFVVGRSNQFAQAAARAVADNPALTYNPLFIYGGSGLGKTHIMQAIGNRLLREDPSFKVFYISAETFMNEMISSIQDNDRLAFRRKYRSMDILLIDDVQFLEGKEATQEEFFHTFNHLHNNHRQIVLTSDRPPKEIRTLEERLISRFEWGLVTDIQLPDLETRIAILRKKAAVDQIDIDPHVTEYIARHVKSNIRELEGSLIRLLAFASITGQEISLQLAQDVLRDHLTTTARPLSIDTIQKAVAEHFGLKVTDMLSAKRTHIIAFPRQIAMYLARNLTTTSLMEIGRNFGGRDHTTVLHACDKISKLEKSDHDTRAALERLRGDLEGR